jgi:uncharacterized protein
MSTTALFVTGAVMGLVAGGASCAAVQGGLLAGAVSRCWAATPVAEPLVAPVGAFLAAKLASHTLLGAILGLLGAAVPLGPRVRAVLLVGAALLMVVFALELAGVNAPRRLVPQPPQACERHVRRSAHSGSTTAPAALGLLTVLVPCGVTLSVELLAVTSGSPWGGAAVMAGFVLGTAPLFVLFGFLLRLSTRLWQGRLTVLAGVVVLAVAIWTAVSGLRLGGWLPGVGAAAMANSPVVAMEPDGTQVITLAVRDTAYVPDVVVARAGVPTVLVLRTHDTRGCVRAFVIVGRDEQRLLPESGEVRINVGVSGAGTLRYVCGMGMYGGRIEFR